MVSRKRQTANVMIRRQALTRYQRLLDEQAGKARDYIRNAVDAFMADNPNASTAETRAFVVELMQAALPNFTTLAETLSCEFMQELCDAYGWDDVTPTVHDTTDYRVVEKRIRYLAEALNHGDEAKFKDQVSEVTSFFVRRSAQDNIIHCCRDAEIRFARVPSGLETCAFCFMLASRGFVYWSEAAAGGQHKFHEHCTCIVVPGEKGRTKIDGYDPATMYRNWKSCEETLGGSAQLSEDWKALSDEERMTYLVKHPAKYGTGYDESEARAEYIRKRVMDEVETRDWHWLYTGEPPEVTYESEALKQDTLKNRPQEARTAERLRYVGIRCHFTKDGEKAGKDANGRQLWSKTADLPNGIELKTVMTSRNAHGAVKNYFDKSIGKKGMRRLIIDNGESKYLSDGQIIEAVLELIDDEDVYRREFPWVSVFGKNGKLVDVVRQERSPGDSVVNRGGF